MIKKYRNIILTNASIIGFGLNNVKADADTKVYVNIGNTTYSEANKGKVDKANLKNLNGLIVELTKLTDSSTLKKNGNSDTDKLDLAKISDEYFVKSVKVGTAEKLNDATLTDLSAATMSTTDANKLTVELVKKEDKINITYNDDTVKGARLIKAKEKEILKKIIQGKATNGLNINNVEFKIGSLTQGSTTNNVIGENIKLFADNEKIKFEITKIKADYKKVVCKFAEEVEEKLVAGVDLEKLCNAANILDNGKKLSEEITALNAVQVKDSNVGIFKSDANLAILPNGDNSKKLVENDKNIPASCDFIVIDGINVDDINPIFLKKTFKVEFVEGGDNKTISKETIDSLNNKLKEKLEDTVIITAKVIFGALKEVSGIKNGFTGNININDNNVVNGDATELKTTNVFIIKLKSDIFENNALKNKIKLTCDFSSINKDLKEVFKNDVNTTLGKINVETTVTDILDKLNADLNGYLTGALDNKDIAIEPTATSGNVNSNSTIKFTKTGIAKLKDCFEAPAKPKGGEGSGSSNGDEQKGDDKKGGEKGYSGSSKKNK